ncbi:MAG: cupin domain-containing protein, partial [Solirubrobacteraceae bacterium]
MRSVNALSDECAFEPDAPAGYRARATHITRALDAQDLAVKVFELPPGESVCPYHYEYEEEWLLVLEGSIVLRTPEGEQTLQRGEIVAFPVGPRGAH